MRLATSMVFARKYATARDDSGMRGGKLRVKKRREDGYGGTIYEG
jgi:hypothetical protein